MAPHPVDAAAGRRQPNCWTAHGRWLLAVDLAAMAIGGMAAQAVRFGTIGEQTVSDTPVSYVLVTTLMAAAWVGTMAFNGCYERRHLGAGSEEYRLVLAAALRFLALVAVVGFVAKFEVARGFVAIAIPVATVVALVGRFIARRWLHQQRGQARFLKQVLVVGTGASADQLTGRLREIPYAGYTVLGICVPAGSPSLEVDREAPVVAFADVEGVLATARQWGVDTIAVADAGTLSPAALRWLSLSLEGTGIDLLLAPAIIDVAGPRILVTPVSELPLLHIEVPELSGARRLVKDAIDRTVAVALLVALLPVLIVIALAIRVSGQGPILFKQVRVGRSGQLFTLWKFRSMIVDAEQHLSALMALNEHDGVLFKMREDPRVTPIGRHLRRWSLDELPQLWNVMRGDMSLVGPRPALPAEVDRFCDRGRRRLLVKPGVTGIWQVNGRAALSWEESLRLDLHYVEHWSLSLDATIVAKTLSAVLRRRGAF